jgi:hypothetical protein
LPHDGGLVVMERPVVMDLARCGARDPREALRVLLADIDAGAVAVEDVAIVSYSEAEGVVVRGSGQRMGSLLTAIGLLHLGIDHLTGIARGAAS